MARLHLRNKREDYEENLLMLTDRFINEIGPWRRDLERQDMIYKVWLHGACLVHKLETPHLVIPHPYAPVGTPGNYFIGPEGPTVVLARHSVVSLFHQFYHHMEATGHEDRSPDQWEHSFTSHAQAWACSLFYITNKKAFRRAVRANHVSGVSNADLLRTRREVSA